MGCLQGSGCPRLVLGHFWDWSSNGVVTGCPCGPGCPQGCPQGAQGAALTVVELVVGLLLGTVGRDPVDLHAHEGIHDGAALVPVELGQLLGCDHLGTGTGHRGHVGVPRRDLGGTWWGWGHGESREVADATQWLTAAGFGDRGGVTQEMCHGWHSEDEMRSREVAGAIQKKGQGGVPRREQMAPRQEWGWGEEEGHCWYHTGEGT